MSFFITLIASLLIFLLVPRIGLLKILLVRPEELNGPQATHNGTSLRLGGIAIFLGLAIDSPAQFTLIPSLLACSLPLFSVALLEDIRGRISPRIRICSILLSAILSIYFIDSISITRLDIPFLGTLTFENYHPLPLMLFTLFCICGLTNAFNIIDGLNGLSSTCAISALISISYVALNINDLLIAKTAIVVALSIFGFLVINLPLGKLFLGDCGAYLIGFLISILSVLIVSRNPIVSPWYPVCINLLPVIDTLFSMYRRKFIHNTKTSESDSWHLHSLVYKNITNKLYFFVKIPDTQKNSLATILISPAIVLSSIIATLNFYSTNTLTILLLAFVVLYVSAYKLLMWKN